MILTCSLFPVFYKLVMIFIDQLYFWLINRFWNEHACQEKYSVWEYVNISEIVIAYFELTSNKFKTDMPLLLFTKVT